MPEEKFCPLKQVVDTDNPSYYRSCDREKCAWWEKDGFCTIVGIPYVLYKIARNGGSE